jgi:hypothetical protein
VARRKKREPSKRRICGLLNSFGKRPFSAWPVSAAAAEVVLLAAQELDQCQIRERKDGMGTPYAGVHGIGLVARDEIRGRDSPLTNRTSDVPRPLRRSTWRGAPVRERGEQGVPAGSQRSDRSSAASHPAPCQSVRPRSRSIRSRKPSKYVHSSAATSLAARGRPGPAFTISCCWREASHASRAAAILFPSDMAVSLGFCRYSVAMLAHAPPDG